MKISLVASNKNSWNVFLNKGLGFFRYPTKLVLAESHSVRVICVNISVNIIDREQLWESVLDMLLFLPFSHLLFLWWLLKNPPSELKQFLCFLDLKAYFREPLYFSLRKNEHRVIRHSFDVFGKFLIKCERALFLSFLLLLNTCGSCLFVILLGSRSGRVRFTCVICALLTRRK